MVNMIDEDGNAEIGFQEFYMMASGRGLAGDLKNQKSSHGDSQETGEAEMTQTYTESLGFESEI